MPVTLLRPLCSVAQVRAELGNQEVNIEEKLMIAINTASRYVEDVTGRDWVLHDYTSSPLVLRRNAGNAILDELLFLPLAPVVEVLSIADDYEGLTDHDDFEVDAKTGIVTRIGSRWGTVVTFTGKLGYEITAADVPPVGLPGNLCMAVVKIAAAWSGEMRRENVGFDGKKTLLADKRIPTDAYDLLCRFIPSNT